MQRRLLPWLGTAIDGRRKHVVVALLLRLRAKLDRTSASLLLRLLCARREGTSASLLLRLLGTGTARRREHATDGRISGRTRHEWAVLRLLLVVRAKHERRRVGSIRRRAKAATGRRTG